MRTSTWLAMAAALWFGCDEQPPIPCVDAGPPLTSPAASEACAAQDVALQNALEAHRRSPNALLAVRNEQCGTRVYMSGDSCFAAQNTLFRIGSVTKTYIAAVILSWVAQQRIALDDEVPQHLPAFPETAGVTLRMLLSHRSGLFNYTDDRAFGQRRGRPIAPEEIVRIALSHPAYFAPDADFRYSNTNYILLGLVIEAISGEPLAAVIRTILLSPLDLQQTFLDGEEVLQGELSRGFAGGMDVTFRVHPSAPWAAGAMVASGSDVANWIWALFATDQILKPTERDLMVQVNPGGGGYGLGAIVIRSATHPDDVGFGHNGGIDGFATTAFYFPRQRTAIIAIVNGGRQPPDVIRNAAFGALFRSAPSH